MLHHKNQDCGLSEAKAFGQPATVLRGKYNLSDEVLEVKWGESPRSDVPARSAYENGKPIYYDFTVCPAAEFAKLGFSPGTTFAACVRRIE